MRCSAPVLVLNGADDTCVTDEDIAAFEKEMDAAGPTGSSSISAAPCIASPRPTPTIRRAALYNERAAKRAYEMMTTSSASALRCDDKALRTPSPASALGQWSRLTA